MGATIKGDHSRKTAINEGVGSPKGSGCSSSKETKESKDKVTNNNFSGKMLVFVPHSDDHALGCGGTIAKYASEGKEVKTIICSFGEMSHPHLKPEVIRKYRVLEAKKSDRILGGSGVLFLGLREGKFFNDINRNNRRLMRNLVAQIKKLNPEKVFVTGPKDVHPDHKAAYWIIVEALKESGLKTELYTFSVYNPFGGRRNAKLYVDISKFFYKKIEALHAFRSQINPFTHAQTNNLLYLSVYLRNFFSGLKKGVKYAEVFDRDETVNNNR